MTTKNMYKKQNKGDVNLYTEKEDDINDLPLSEISEFEDWLDSVNKYNDLLDYGEKT
jgi:hypothetical protein